MPLLLKASASLRRAGATRRVASGALAFASVGMVSTVDGGYFPATWGWVALSLLFVAASTLILADRVEIGIFEVFWLSLAALFLGSEPNSPNE